MFRKSNSEKGAELCRLPHLRFVHENPGVHWMRDDHMCHTLPAGFSEDQKALVGDKWPVASPLVSVQDHAAE
jgi:hypothetical protein